MSDDPYHNTPARVYSDSKRGVWFLMDHVVSVVRFRSRDASSVQVFLKSGQTVDISWSDPDEAIKLYKSLMDSLEIFNR